MQPTGKNTIGTQLSQLGSHTFRTFDPVQNSENEPLFYEATKEEVDRAMQLAHEAFPAFAQTSGRSRAAFLRRIASLLEAHREVLIARYSMESGLDAGRGGTELNRTIFHCGAFADMIEDDTWRHVNSDAADPQRKPLPKPGLHKIFFPLGPVVVFGASNFPFAYSTIGGDAASAFAAGCPVIIKSHPMHAGTGDLVSQLIVQAAQETGMPEGIFSNLNASGFEVGEQLVLHPFTKAVGFTGSVGGGLALHKLGQQRKELIPVFSEMGSLNPVFILPGAMKEPSDIVAKLADSVTQSSGQFCTKPGLIFAIDTDGFGELKKQLAEAIGAKEPQSMLHPDIWKKYNALRKEIAEQEGVTVLTGESPGTKPNFGQPQLSFVHSAVFNENPKLHQEVFGPHSLLIACKDEKELLASLGSLEGQLTCAVFASEGEMNENHDLIFTMQLKAGRIINNGVPTGVEVSPSMHHGGPFPATTDSRFTAVGIQAVLRFVRPVSLQNFPQVLLPKFLKENSF